MKNLDFYIAGYGPLKFAFAMFWFIIPAEVTLAQPFDIELQNHVRHSETRPASDLLCRDAWLYLQESYTDSSQYIHSCPDSNPAVRVAYYMNHHFALPSLNNGIIILSMISTYLKNKTELQRPIPQDAQNPTELFPAFTKKQTSIKIWILAIVSCILASSLLFLSLAYRTTKQQALELKLLNQQLYRTEQQLRRHNIKLEQFSRITAHDILANLNLILSAGNTWVGAHPKKEHLMRYHAMTNQTAQRLKEYCVGLLEETRQKNTEGAQSPTDPMPVLKGVLESFEPALQASGFEVQTTPLSPVLLPAPIQEQIFRNLITNTIVHAAATRQPLLRIVEERTESGLVYWILEDNGPGIPLERQEAIFNAGIPQKKGPGQQMGLSLLRTMLRQYGTDIQVEERKGGGARFIVTPNTPQPQNIT